MISGIEDKLHDYWERRSRTYYVPDVFGRRILAAFIGKLKPQSLIEVGCGNGELFNIYKDIPRVMGIDWSNGMLERAHARIERHEYKNIELRDVNIITGWVPERFDVAVTRTCLMHIDPENIEAACRHLTDMSDNLLLFELYDPNFRERTGAPLDWHNFHHEYPSIFRPLGYELIGSYDRPDGLPQLLFHFRKGATEEAKPIER